MDWSNSTYSSRFRRINSGNMGAPGSGPPNFDTDHVVTQRAGGAAVPVDERVDVIQPPQAVRGQRQRIGGFQVPVDLVDERVHQLRDTIVRGRTEVTHRDRTRAVLTGVHMQTANGMEVQRLDDRCRNHRSIDRDGRIDDRGQKTILPIVVIGRENDGMPGAVRPRRVRTESSRTTRARGP